MRSSSCARRQNLSESNLELGGQSQAECYSWSLLQRSAAEDEANAQSSCMFSDLLVTSHFF